MVLFWTRWGRIAKQRWCSGLRQGTVHQRCGRPNLVFEITQWKRRTELGFQARLHRWVCACRFWCVKETYPMTRTLRARGKRLVGWAANGCRRLRQGISLSEPSLRGSFHRYEQDQEGARSNEPQHLSIAAPRDQSLRLFPAASGYESRRQLRR